MGYDARDALAYRVACSSIYRHAAGPVEVFPLMDWRLRWQKLYHRAFWTDEHGQRTDSRDGRPFSTDFSFTRFLVPALEEYGTEWVLFVDPDVLFLDSVHKLFDLIDPGKDLMCVQHDHVPTETTKMAGLRQTIYKRKNWSSLMLMRPSGLTDLTKYVANNSTGEFLHSLAFCPDDRIGPLPVHWNYLVGINNQLECPDPKMVHFTLGTPDLPGYEQDEFSDDWYYEAAVLHGWAHNAKGGLRDRRTTIENARRQLQGFTPTVY
jgi:lipopolysaccharide biosynthesis glycosyltransferase